MLVGVGGRACAEGWGDEEGDGCGGGGGEEGGLGGAGGLALAVALSADGEGVFFVDAVDDVSDLVVADETAAGSCGGGTRGCSRLRRGRPPVPGSCPPDGTPGAHQHRASAGAGCRRCCR